MEHLLHIFELILVGLITKALWPKVKKLNRKSIRKWLTSFDHVRFERNFIKVFSMVYAPIMVLAVILSAILFSAQCVNDFSNLGIPTSYAVVMATLKFSCVLIPSVIYLRFFLTDKDSFYKLKINKF